ncbi:MAG: PEP-utilizing enzyme [Gammaproteobacteria bacterium]|nr:PEP-utilizing enzyme [Gammaproteobacteria bacterium]
MTTATHVLPFDAASDKTVDLDTLGGKGLSLARMATAGLPVPPGFTVATSAYRKFVAGNDLQHAVLEHARPQVVGQTASFKAASERLQALFAGTPPSDELKNEIEAAYAAFGSGEPPVAVRSSANAEDLPDLSFAGQHDTYLNVRGAEAVITAVQNCWASLWTERAIGYRHENGIDQETVAMAVVVQRMVASEVSGVLFTANPTTGDRSEIVVNSSYGLGEAIVGGEVTPDTFIVDRDTLTTQETAVGTKETVVVPANGQGTRTRQSTAAERQRLSLAVPALKELAGIAKEVERHFDGIPQDIEWAVSGGSLSLLQSRPMTNLPPAPLKNVKWETPEPGARLERDQIVEFMPGPLSPLFQDVYLPALDVAYYLMRVSQGGNEAGGATYRQLAKVLGGQHGGQSVVNGYAYRHFPPPGNPFVLRAQGGRARRSRFNVRDVSRGYHETPRRWRHEELPKYLGTIELWRQLDPATAEDERLLAGIRTLSWADAHYWRFVDEVLAFPRRADEALQEFLIRHAPGANLTSGMLLDGSGSPTMRAPIDLWRIAQRIQSVPALHECVATTPAHRLLATLDGFTDGQAVVRELTNYLAQYGHQIYSLDYAEPTPSQDPTQILSLLKSLVLEPDYDPASQQAETKATRRQALRDASRHFRGRLWWQFRWRLFWAQHYYPNRDESQFYLGAGWPVLQRLALELGRRLVAVGALTRPDDVYYLDGSELDRAIEARRDEVPVPDLRHSAVQRRELREARKRLSPPPAIPQRGPPSAPEEDAKNIITGVAVSPGKVTAEVSVILSLTEFDQMRPRSILVCPLTTPAWTQLFPHAVGLVTDVGGITAHGSIVAREYGIPAVLGLGDVTKRLSSGQTITVDGFAGTVTIEDGSAVSVPMARGNASRRVAVPETAAFIGLATPLLFKHSARKRLLGLLARPFKAAFYQALLFIYFKLTGPSGGPAAPAAGRRTRAQPHRPQSN